MLRDDYILTSEYILSLEIKYVDNIIFRSAEAEYLLHYNPYNDGLSFKRKPNKITKVNCYKIKNYEILTRVGEYNSFLKMNYHKYLISERLDTIKILDKELTNIDIRYISRHWLDYITIRNIIWQHNLRLIIYVTTQKLHKSSSRHLDDLISNGHIWLWRLIERFDIEYGVAFNTYAVKSLERYCWSYIARIKSKESTMQDISQYEFVSDDLIDQKESEDHIVKTINDMLTPREKFIVNRIYGLNELDKMTYDKIGEVIGVSKQRIYQILMDALSKLRKYLKP